MNDLRQRGERLLDEQWLDVDRARVEIAVGRIRRRRWRATAVGAAVVVVLAVALFELIPQAETTSLRTADVPERVYGPGDVDTIVFLDPTSTPEQADEIEAVLRGDPDVGQAWARSQQDAYDEFRCQFLDEPEMIESVSPEILPSSFRIALVDGADPTDLEISMQRFEVVNEVVGSPTPADRARAEDLTGSTVEWPKLVDSGCSAAGRPIK